MQRRDRRESDRLVCVSGKAGFRTQQAALLKLTAAQEKPRKYGAPVRTYRCDLCPWWHLTSRPDKKGQSA